MQFIIENSTYDQSCVPYICVRFNKHAMRDIFLYFFTYMKIYNGGFFPFYYIKIFSGGDFFSQNNAPFLHICLVHQSNSYQKKFLGLKKIPSKFLTLSESILVIKHHLFSWNIKDKAMCFHLDFTWTFFHLKWHNSTV